MKTNYANMYFLKYMLFIWMSKMKIQNQKNLMHNLYYFPTKFITLKLFITIKLNKIMKKITKLNEIKHQKKLLLFPRSQKLKYNSCNRNELTYIFDK
jgi:hypothetical protein